jgi:hypothetical protein
MGCTERVLKGGKIIERDCHTGGKPASGDSAGPGTELKALLKSWFGIEASIGCKCGAMAAKMNQNGPDWCEGSGMEEILGAMRSEHDKRRSKKETILPWSNIGAKALVKIACRRARKKSLTQ